MTVAVPGFLRRDARPPIEMEAAPAPGAVTAMRPTAIPRRFVYSVPFDEGAPGHEPQDAMVRRFWTAIVGSGAVVDLLRLIAASQTGRRLPEPLHLGILAAEGLIERDDPIVLVRPRVPHLGDSQLLRLRPSLRAEYRRLLDG
ncbi:MAG: hypothetical protein Q8Q29_09880 [Actinomycetota bacterium]|jgi:hypothetical protein|nr:hypothetical protein [Actinomycetota bacterium]